MKEGEPKPEEKIGEPERTSGIMRVRGASPQLEKEILDEIKEKEFNIQEFNKAEREKTPEEAAIIERILIHLPDFVEEHGGVPVKLKPEHVHIIVPEKLPDDKKWLSEKMEGFYRHETQSAVIFAPSADENKLNFANLVVHELMHFNAFQTVNFDPETKGVSERVDGLSIMIKEDDKKTPYFHDINEAMTAELAKRFDQEYFRSIPALEKEIKERDRFVGRLKNRRAAEEIMSYSLTQEESGMWRARSEDYSHPKDRKKLWEIIGEIQQNNTEQFETKEDVFKLFAEAYFTGRIMKVARLIEKLKDEKGYFRKLGKGTRTKGYSKPENKE